MEIWKNILGYEGIYQVSSCGLIRSVDRTLIKKRNPKTGKPCINKMKGRLKKFSVSKIGYRQVSLYKNLKSETLLVSRIVATAFIKNNENKPEVNHIDGNKENNNISNLEWCTSKENKCHAIANGYYNNCYKSLRKKIIEKTEDGNIIWDSLKDLCEKKKLHKSTLSKYLNGKSNNSNGLNIKYIL